MYDKKQTHTKINIDDFLGLFGGEKLKIIFLFNIKTLKIYFARKRRKKDSIDDLFSYLLLMGLHRYGSV